tara:strand:+ start:3006 stop:3434 length:429 start_codon:yes stop_codon:yes gene_type:complete
MTITYVGVYLTYAALPIIVVSGLLMRLTKPKVRKPRSEFSVAAEGFLSEVSSGLEEMHGSLDKFNKKNELIRTRTRELGEQKQALKLKRVEPNIKLKYEKSAAEKEKLNKVIKSIDSDIIDLEMALNKIKLECELEIERKYV